MHEKELTALVIVVILGLECITSATLIDKYKVVL